MSGVESIAVAKATSMVVLGGAAFVVTLLPVAIARRVSSSSCPAAPDLQRKSSRMELVLSLFLAFGGGVLLCTTFLHLLPEVAETIDKLQKRGIISEDFPLPLAEFMMCCGFFVMYIVEEVVHKYLHSRQHHKHKGGCDNPLNVSSTVLVETEMTPPEKYRNTIKEEFGVPVLGDDSKTSHYGEDLKIVPGSGKNYGSSDTLEVNGNFHEHRHDGHVDHDHQHHVDHHVDHDHRPHEHALVTDEPPSLRELLIVLALTVHEGFEGMAIGLESSVAAVWYLMVAVAVHKCVIAFCIGVELVSGHVSTGLCVFYAFIYSCASPFGIGLGLLLTSGGGEGPDHLTSVLSVVLQGMATGTLLYVVFFEILKRDGHGGGGGLLQLAVVILGFVMMASITIFIDA